MENEPETPKCSFQELLNGIFIYLPDVHTETESLQMTARGLVVNEVEQPVE